jgi:phosphoserine phosphatase
MTSIRKTIILRLSIALPLLLGAACVVAQPNQNVQNVPPAVRAAPIAWSSLSPDEQQILESVHKNWDQLPAQQRLLRGAQRWATLTPEQRNNVRSRFEKWNSLPQDQREKLRERYEKFKQLPPDQQERIRQAFKRFGSLPPDQRQHLREKFNQMSPSEREAFLMGANAQNRAAMLREFLQSIPQDERRETRQTLQGLPMEQRRAFMQTWRGLPQDQRDAYRRRIVRMAPDQRAAELSKVPLKP